MKFNQNPKKSWANIKFIILEKTTVQGIGLTIGRKATGQKAGNCHRVDCLNGSNEPATDGAHVQLDSPDDRRWLIVPLCRKCNCQFGAHFSVKGPLVSAADPKEILK